MTVKIQWDDMPKSLADWIAEKYKFVTSMDNEEIFVYNNGIYHEEGEALIKEEVEKIGEKNYFKITTHLTNEVINHIKRRTYVKRNDFNKHSHLIHLQNGIYNLKTNELQNFDPKIISTTQLPIEYDPKADCPTIQKFLSEILHESDIPTIQELFGYCLLKSYTIQKAFLFIGEGSNGKSTLLALLKAFLGKENIASISLQELENDRFAKANLFGKLANIYPDLTDEQMKKTGVFKMLTGGDPISADQKFKGRVDFVNYAKLCFSANKAPEVLEDSDAFFRRWIIVTFPNTFTDETADKNILQKLTTPEELSGLFNWAIEGLNRLLENGRFTNSESVEVLREHYTRVSSPLQAFVMDCCKTGIDEWIWKNDLYSAYVQYCQDKKLPVKAKNKFGMDLATVVPALSDAMKKRNGRQERFWRGINLKEDIQSIHVSATFKCTWNNNKVKENTYTLSTPYTDSEKDEIAENNNKTNKKQQNLEEFSDVDSDSDELVSVRGNEGREFG